MKTIVTIAVASVLCPVLASAQNAPTNIGLSDLLNGGWSNSKHYTPDPKTQAIGDKNKLESEKNQFDKNQEKAKQGWDYAKKGYKAGKSLYDAFTKFDDVMKSYDHLTPKDGPFDPNYTPPGMPEIPSNCAGSNACGDCYKDAYGKLTAVRIRFEKLRVLNASTQAWITKALAFGDSTSGIHGIVGLAWQTERRKIEQSIDGFNAAYDRKYAELLGVLKEALQAIAACEAAHFNEPDWYNRFGFMYYSFMSDKYQR